MIAAAAAAVAIAAQAQRPEFHAYRVTAAVGSERVDFSGDDAAGCADHGVCGITGTETWTPVRPEPGTIGAVTRVGRRVAGQAFLTGGNTTASVSSPGSDAPCTDAFYVRQAVVTFRHTGARVQALLHGPVGEPPLGQDAAVFATHCAGPRIADLATAGALPTTVLRVSSLRRRTLTLKLLANAPFAQAGFSGQVVADVRVRLKRDRALERILAASGGLVVSPGSAPGSSAPP